MSSRLTLQALQTLREDEELREEIRPYTDLKPSGVLPAIIRNSPAFTNWYVVEAIARKMGKKPEDIIEIKNSTSV